jgi:HD-GYP domain-containing protein (c-di-GMP phosphodiesterase class II)
MKKEFYSIRINTLRAHDPIPFDIFIYIASRYLHYTRINDEMEESRLKNLKSKGVKKLFIEGQDEDRYLKYLESGINSLSDTRMTVEDRASLANDTMLSSVENAEKNLETEVGYNSQKNQLEKISQFIGSERGPIKSMLAAAGISIDNNQHSATVSSLSMALATKLGTLSSNDIVELGFAALLHDIGKTRLSFDANIPVAKMTPTQLKQYKNHPADGVAMLAGKPFVSPRILGLVVAHEEYGHGKGFPEKKNVFSLDTSYQILSLVNKLDRFCQDNSLTHSAAIDPFFSKHDEDFDQTLVSTFVTILT